MDREQDGARLTEVKREFIQSILLTEEQHFVVYFRESGKRGRMLWVRNGLEEEKQSGKRRQTREDKERIIPQYTIIESF